MLEIEGYKLVCSGETIILHCGRYGNSINGRLAISATCIDEEFGFDIEQPFATLTVNLPEQKLWPREIFVKTWSENKNFAASVLKENLFIDTGRRVITGHCEAEVWKLADNVISSEEAPKTCYGLGINYLRQKL